jgi:iron complex transport system permease protein
VAQDFIVHDLRLPRVLVGLLVGAALGLAGAVFQSVSRNPLGSPDVIGFGQGSAAGALAVIVLFQGDPTAVATGAVCGGLLTGVAIYTLAWRQGVHGYRLVLVGIGVSAMLTAVNGYLLTKADLVDATRAVVWMTGSLNGRDWSQVWPLLCVCAVLLPVVLGQRARAADAGDGRRQRVRPRSAGRADAAGAHVRGRPADRLRHRRRRARLLRGARRAAAGPQAPHPFDRVPTCSPRPVHGRGPAGHRRLVRAAGLRRRPAARRGADRVLGGVYLLWLLVTERKAGRI